MTAFTLRLAARSMRWLAPAIIVILWTAFTVSSPGTALGNASNAFMMIVVVSCWLTVGVGNVDDDGHRELLAAAAGSPARLQRSRAFAAFAGANVLALVPTVAGVALATSPARPTNGAAIVAACLLVQVAATAIGVGIGTLLHRPVVRHAGITLLVAAGALVGLILLPPVQHVLRQLNDDRFGGVIVLGLVALAAGGVAVAAAGALADRSS